MSKHINHLEKLKEKKKEIERDVNFLKFLSPQLEDSTKLEYKCENCGEKIILKLNKYLRLRKYWNDFIEGCEVLI